jgi:alcohol dehydrogenase YqhD (iron-dependent ADH family)
LNNFTYYNPTKIYFGRDTIKNIGREMRERGVKKALLVCGRQSIFSTGVYDQVSSSLIGWYVDFIRFSGVQPNPLLSKVEDGIRLARQEGVDAILAVGGGSVFDSAKVIAAGVEYEGPVWDLFTGQARIKSALPLFGVLTLSATGSEMNGSAVITKADEKKKWGIVSRHLYPRVSIIDPSVQAWLTKRDTVNGAVDILSHVFELYFDGSKSGELMQEYSEAIIRTVIKNIKILLENPADYEARAQMAWAATLALNNSNAAGRSGGDWATHDIEHSISAFYDVAHGAGLAVITPAWMCYVYREDLHTFARFAQKIFGINSGTVEEQAQEGIRQLREFFREIGAPLSLQDLGVEYQDLENMAENAVQARTLGRLKPLQRDDVLAIYQLAWDQQGLNKRECDSYD